MGGAKGMGVDQVDAIDDLITRVIEREGGYVNHPSDNGGPTKYGVTQGALASWRGFHVEAYDVQQLQESEARAIYRANYFDKPGFGTITYPPLLEFLFDYGVNSGPTAAVQALQRALSVTPDGAFGPLSKAALGRCTNLPALFYRVKAERYELLLRFIGSDPSQAVFATGWANRLDQFEVPLT